VAVDAIDTVGAEEPLAGEALLGFDYWLFANGADEIFNLSYTSFFINQVPNINYRLRFHRKFEELLAAPHNAFNLDHSIVRNC